MPEYLARLPVSATRRWAGAIVLALVGLGLIYSGFSYPSATAVWRMALFLFGALLILQAYWNLQVRSGALVLKEDGLWVEGGDRLVGLDNVETVQTSPFSIKPSNGFAVVVKQPVGFRWVPGLYWSVGHRVGVGGATSPARAKAMAELLSAMIVDR